MLYATCLIHVTLRKMYLGVRRRKIALKNHFFDIATQFPCALGLKICSIGFSVEFPIDCICFRVKRVKNSNALNKQRLKGHHHPSHNPSACQPKTDFFLPKDYSCVPSLEGRLHSKPWSCLPQARTRSVRGNMLLQYLIMLFFWRCVKALDFLWQCQRNLKESAQTLDLVISARKKDPRLPLCLWRCQVRVQQSPSVRCSTKAGLVCSQRVRFQQAGSSFLAKHLPKNFEAH